MTRAWVMLWLWLCGTAASAQQGTYIQVEAQPTYAEAVAAARKYATVSGSVSGYRLGGSWYAIVLGPYPPESAEAELDRLRFWGQVPRDSYVTTLENYGPRFYPDDGTLPALPPLLAEPGQATLPPPPPLPAAPGPAATAGLPDETPAEAAWAERMLAPEDRALVQTALTDAGVYVGPVDAAFGPGTRQAMADWQAANGFEPTGVLTMAQRTALIAAYRSALDGLGMERIADPAAGIEIALPMAAVARAAEASPFVRYEPTGELPVRVLLISQRGDAAALGGLYEIMQTLAVVPLEGPRTRTPTSFEIEGRNGEIVSTTRAELVGDEIKGFTLVWPTGDERRRTRVLGEMRASFTRVPGVLPEPPEASSPAPDVLAGLEVRRPERDRSGFYVDGSGAVLTTHEAVDACGRVTLDDATEAEVAAADEGLGLALLRPRAGLSPIRYARFRSAPPRLRSEIAVAGYPFGGVLPAPSLNFGTLADARGLDGDASKSRLDLASEPGETGGPVLDGGGAVVGILLPPDDGARIMPEGVAFAVAVEPIATFLSAAGLSAAASEAEAEMRPAELTRLAADMTVLVRCWN